MSYHVATQSQAMVRVLMMSRIRPLMHAEIRARTLTGRYQINNGGQHLVDGVPFGRPYLRQPNRPDVRIPPRERQMLEETTDYEETPLLLEAEQHEQGSESQLATNGTALVRRSPQHKGTGAQNSVHFAQPQTHLHIDGASEDEDDDDYAPDAESDEAGGEGSDGSRSDSDTNPITDSSSASDASDSDSDSSSDGSSNESDSDSDSDSDDEAPEVQSSKAPVPRISAQALQPPTVANMSPPGEGKRTTQSRNARRSKSNRLRYLKEAGKLHEDADLKDLEKYDEELGLHQKSQEEQRQAFAHPTGKRKRIEDEEPTKSAADETVELERMKRAMMARIHEMDNISMDVDEQTLSRTEETTAASPQQHVQEAAVTIDKPPERKRLRPDVSAIGRMLVRQTKNLAKKPAMAKEATPEPEGSTDPDFWKSRINLSAFECWEEEYELTAPPFPFVQHWDPVGKVMRDAAKKRKGKKGGKKAPPVQEPEEEEEEEEEKIFLNYDDDNPDVEIHAAIEDQLQQDIATASQEHDNLPPLPKDLAALPDLTSADIKAGAVIVCKFFGVNPVTVTPEISGFKTATVEQEGDSGACAGILKLRIAQRDLPKKEKKFNSKGDRIYDAKDGFFMDEEEEEGLWSGMFGELLEAKLLKAA